MIYVLYEFCYTVSNYSIGKLFTTAKPIFIIFVEGGNSHSNVK